MSTTETTVASAPAQAPANTPAAPSAPRGTFGGFSAGGRSGGAGGQRGGNRGGAGAGRGQGQGGARGGARGPRKGGNAPRERSEFDQRILAIRRVARTTAGGRRFNFSVVVVIGNRKGGVGVGLGKAGDTSLAIDKAVRDARKNLLTIPLTKNASIAHDVEAKYCSAQVVMFPSAGRGLVAGSAIREVLELAGITDINAKILSGSKNKLNMAHAAIEALKKVRRSTTGSAADAGKDVVAKEEVVA